MSGVGAVEGVRGPNVPQQQQGLARAEPRPLLEPPAELGDPNTAMLVLHKIMLSMRANSTESGKARIERNEQLVKHAIEETHKAREEQWEAEEDQGGFWSDLAGVFGEIGKWVGAVASTALAICSCGAATPIAVLAVSGAVLSCASAIDSTFGISKELLGESASMWLNLGMSIGAAVCSGGAGVASMFGKGVQTAATATSGALRFSAGALTTAAGAANVTSSVARGVVAGYRHDAETAAADVAAGENRQKRIERQISAILDVIQKLVESRDRGVAKVGEMMSRQNDANVSLLRA